MRAIEDRKIIDYIKENGGCKFRHMMQCLGLSKKDDELYHEWMENKYRPFDSQLQTLKRKGVIEYRKGKGGGWFVPEPTPLTEGDSK